MLHLREAERTPNSLLGCWLEYWPKSGLPKVSKLEMPVLPWFNVEEGIQRLKEAGISQWVSHLRPTTHTGRV